MLIDDGLILFGGKSDWVHLPKVLQNPSCFFVLYVFLLQQGALLTSK